MIFMNISSTSRSTEKPFFLINMLFIFSIFVLALVVYFLIVSERSRSILLIEIHQESTRLYF